jgi:hypothetical protein
MSFSWGKGAQSEGGAERTRSRRTEVPIQDTASVKRARRKIVIIRLISLV